MIQYQQFQNVTFAKRATLSITPVLYKQAILRVSVKYQYPGANLLRIYVCTLLAKQPFRAKGAQKLS